MKLRDLIAPALAALLAPACAHTTSAQARAESAEDDKAHAQEDARRARVNAEQARLDAQDADRARYEADQRAAYASAEAAQAERDAQIGQATGVAESQPVYADSPRVTFAVSSYDLPGSEQQRLDEIAASLRAHPGRRIVIQTFADDYGDTDRDARLAQHRADAVAHYLENRGVSGDRIGTKVVTRDAASSWRVESDRHHRSVVIVTR